MSENSGPGGVYDHRSTVGPASFQDRPAEQARLHELLVEYTTGADHGLFELLDLVARYPILAIRVLSEVRTRRQGS